jgi:DNA repair exonuclease SbcCD nuclease subunit
VKILLTADWHIGVRSDSELYHNIFKTWVEDFLVPTIKNEEVNSLCILGDFYDNRNAVNTKSDNLGMWAIEYILANTANIKPTLNIYIIVSNHDMYHKNSREIHSLKKFEHYDRVIVINSIMKFRFGTKEVVFAPWILEEDKHTLTNMKGDILLGHFPFNGYEMVRGFAETKGFSFEEIKNNYLKVFSGHFHLRNDVYVGNPFQMSWADTEDDKGVTILDTETLQTKCVLNIVSPIYKKIYLSQLKNKTISLDIIKGNFIKIFLDDKYNDKMVEKLQEVVKSKEPLSFTFEGLGDDEINIDVAVKDLTNPIESLILWLNQIELKKGVERDILIEKVNSLYNSSLK